MQIEQYILGILVSQVQGRREPVQTPGYFIASGPSEQSIFFIE